MDTRTNKEDFALTPYIFLVKYIGEFKIFGFGLCWGWWSISIQIGFNVPSEVPFIFNPETLIKQRNQ